ncbi:Cysteine desulfurase IscS [Thalassocella blandensis]|nr:Cysteine desulfurase IscS [Thalassocella blandensis]
MKMPIYLDYAATTPVDERVAQAMLECLTREGNFGNPASRTHLYGWKAEEAVEDARNSLAELIQSDSREIVWTSGATEASNLAIKGALAYHTKSAPLHIITSEIEHKSVLDCCQFLQSLGHEVSYLKPPQDGVIRASQVEQALTDNTVLVSIMHVNNEIGTINDIAEIGNLCRDRGILFHVDAAQSVGKIPVNVSDLCVDLMSISAHKMYGPKGQGALYVRRHPDVNVVPQIHGGGHERGMRSGTLATHQIVGMGKAAGIAKLEQQADFEKYSQLRECFIAALNDLPDVFFNGSKSQSVPNIVNLSFAGVDGEALLTSLRELALSSGSACNSVSVESSYVLRAMGVADELAHSSLRISIGKPTTQEDMMIAAEKIMAAVTQLRQRSLKLSGSAPR